MQTVRPQSEDGHGVSAAERDDGRLAVLALGQIERAVIVCVGIACIAGGGFLPCTIIGYRTVRTAGVRRKCQTEQHRDEYPFYSHNFLFFNLLL